MYLILLNGSDLWVMRSLLGGYFTLGRGNEMEQIIRLIEVTVWPSTILLLTFVFRLELRTILTNISGLEVRSGEKELKITLVRKMVKGIEEQTRLLADNSRKEKIEQHVRTIEQINSLSSTQTKILLILDEGATSRMELSRKLRNLYGSETRASVIQDQLEELIGFGLIKEKEEGIYELV